MGGDGEERRDKNKNADDGDHKGSAILYIGWEGETVWAVLNICLELERRENAFRYATTICEVCGKFLA